jgi:Zn-dependent protease with chaperone function
VSSSSDLSALVHPKERLYFGIALVVSLLLWTGLGLLLVSGPEEMRGGFLMYGIAIGVFLAVSHGLLVGRIRGNGVRVSARQFPELHELVLAHTARLGMPTPDVFVLQAGGTLNAFAMRFLRRDFVVLYSDVFELAAAEGAEAVSFIVGHELGHLKRRHPTWRLLLLPSHVVPLLARAYSRACEYTCDRIGAYCAPHGGVAGLLVLAAGKGLYRRVDPAMFAAQAETEDGFWTRVAETFSSHPTLTKRVAALRERGVPAPAYTPVLDLRSEAAGV